MNAIRRRICLVSFLSIMLFLISFFSSFDNSSKITVSFDIYQQQLSNKTKINRKIREPIIFSKSKYFNQTHNVRLFSNFVF